MKTIYWKYILHNSYRQTVFTALLHEVSTLNTIQVVSAYNARHALFKSIQFIGVD